MIWHWQCRWFIAMSRGGASRVVGYFGTSRLFWISGGGITVVWLPIPRWPTIDIQLFFAQRCEAPSRQAKARVRAIGRPWNCNNKCVSEGRRPERTAAIELNISQCCAISDWQSNDSNPLKGSLIMNKSWSQVTSPRELKNSNCEIGPACKLLFAE